MNVENLKERSQEKEVKRKMTKRRIQQQQRFDCMRIATIEHGAFESAGGRTRVQAIVRVQGARRICEQGVAT